ncbi:tetratricopeptide repeat protein [Paenibacillus anaericanus]|uniref:Tetratricopeptide repeat protein n=1 Tax=Paenibacillus anaericanus TaxID=170367 RepID=A0A3S1DFV3_9BACL|nr:tetratricopeptide repeat protein [Paenibacillus anaericanus]RUT43977.1 tetratricopeptide repeat protein [Paenibacillus anaericanus]
MQFGLKYVCRNENCDYQEVTVSKSWYSRLADDPQLWNIAILQEGPSIIAQQYEKLRRLLSAGSTYGAQLKLKDMFEMLVKFSTLLLVSEMVEVEKNSSEYNEILSFMTSKPLSLGDWQHVAYKLIDTNRSSNSRLIGILKDIHGIYTKYNIVSWRNDKIGHGALLLDDSLDFQIDIEKKVHTIVEHFHRCEELYSGVRILLRNNYNSFFLIGSGDTYSESMVDEKLIVQFDGKEIKLEPFVQYIDNNVYLFDSYYSMKSTASFINYSTGHKKKQKPTTLTDIYNSMQRKHTSMIATASAENDIYIRSQADTINRIMSSEDLIEFKFLLEDLKRAIEENDRGYILLEMANGMGKSTFAKMLDPLVYDLVRLDNIVCRTYYINDIFSHVPSIFVSKLSDLLRQLDRSGEMLDGDIPNIDVESAASEKNVSKLLNTLFTAHKKYKSAEKMILIVDGVDEIPARSGKSIFDMLPSPEMLDDGIYILITCRMDEQLSLFTKDKLALISFIKKMSVEPTDPRYQEMLEEFVDFKLKEQKLKPITEDVKKLIQISEGSFIHLRILIKAYLEKGMEAVHASPIKAEEHFLELLSRMYGEQYFREMLGVLMSLSFSAVSPSIKQLSQTFGEEEISFKFLCFLNELKPLLDIRRTGKGNLISIHRKELREILEDKYEPAIDQYMTKLIEGVHFIIGNTQERPLEDDEAVYIVNALTALLNRNHDTFGSKIGERISPIFRLLSYHFQQGGAYSSEQQQQCYYLLYTHINLAIRALAKAQIPFNPDDYLFLMETISKLLINANMLDVAVEKLEEGLFLLEEQHISVGQLPLSECYNSLATLYSKQGIKSKAEQYFMRAKMERNNIKGNTIDSKVRVLKSELVQMLNEAIFYKNRNKSNEALTILKQLERKISRFEEQGGDGKLIVSEKINMLKTACNIFKRTNPQDALNLAIKARELLPYMYKQDEILARGTESDLLLNLGQVYRQLEMPDKAINCFDEAIKMNMRVLQLGGTVVPEEMVKLYNSKGNIQYDENNYKQAITLYSQAIEQYEEFTAQGRQISTTLFFQILISRRNAYQAEGNFEKAESDFQRASEIKYDRELTAYTLQGKLK